MTGPFPPLPDDPYTGPATPQEPTQQVPPTTGPTGPQPAAGHPSGAPPLGSRDAIQSALTGSAGAVGSALGSRWRSLPWAVRIAGFVQVLAGLFAFSALASSEDISAETDSVMNAYQSCIVVIAAGMLVAGILLNVKFNDGARLFASVIPIAPLIVGLNFPVTGIGLMSLALPTAFLSWFLLWVPDSNSKYLKATR